MSLKEYIDSENIIKVTWEQLGITDAYHIRIAIWEYDIIQYPYCCCQALYKFEFKKLNVKSLNALLGSDFTYSLSGFNDFPALKDFDTSEIEDMSYFINDTELTSIDLSHFNTSNVTNMLGMFQNNSMLTDLNLSSFDTSNVENMRSMFYKCKSIKSLVLSNFDISKVKGKFEMGNMFAECYSLISVKGSITGINYDLDLSDCPLDNESAMVFINGLSTVSTNETITFSKITYDTLTEAQKKIATDKGWTVKSA